MQVKNIVKMSTTTGDARVTIISYNGNKRHLIIRHPTDSRASSPDGQSRQSLLPLRKRFKRKLRKTCETECGICKSKSGHYTTVFKLGEKKGTRKCWDCCGTTQVCLKVKSRSPATSVLKLQCQEKQNAQQ